MMMSRNSFCGNYDHFNNKESLPFTNQKEFVVSKRTWLSVLRAAMHAQAPICVDAWSSVLEDAYAVQFREIMERPVLDAQYSLDIECALASSNTN